MNSIIESGSNTIFTVDIMRHLGIQPYDLDLPENQMRFSSIVHFLEKYPDPSLFISRAKMLNSAQSNGDKLRYLDEYVQLHQKRTSVEQSLQSINQEISVYEK
jgi:hypothetical protein